MTLPIDERVAKLLTMDDMGDVLAPARIAHELGFNYLCWLYLMEIFERFAWPHCNVVTIESPPSSRDYS